MNRIHRVLMENAMPQASADTVSPEKATDPVYDPIHGEGKVLLTPKEQPAPRINGPSVFGVRPGSPFLYTIPATGERPIRFSVDQEKVLASARAMVSKGLMNHGWSYINLEDAAIRPGQGSRTDLPFRER